MCAACSHYSTNKLGGDSTTKTHLVASARWGWSKDSQIRLPTPWGPSQHPQPDHAFGILLFQHLPSSQAIQKMETNTQLIEQKLPLFASPCPQNLVKLLPAMNHVLKTYWTHPSDRKTVPETPRETGKSQTLQETRMQLDDLSYPLPMMGLPHHSSESLVTDS